MCDIKRDIETRRALSKKKKNLRCRKREREKKNHSPQKKKNQKDAPFLFDFFFLAGSIFFID